MYDNTYQKLKIKTTGLETIELIKGVRKKELERVFQWLLSFINAILASS